MQFKFSIIWSSVSHSLTHKSVGPKLSKLCQLFKIYKFFKLYKFYKFYKLYKFYNFLQCEFLEARASLEASLSVTHSLTSQWVPSNLNYVSCSRSTSSSTSTNSTRSTISTTTSSTSSISCRYGTIWILVVKHSYISSNHVFLHFKRGYFLGGFRKIGSYLPGGS